MKKFVFVFLLAVFATAFSSNVSAQTMMKDTVNVGGQAMYRTKNIVENAVNSKDHTTLVAAVKAAGLVDTLMSRGPFTVFAPTNNAFNALPAGTVETLVKPENKATLTKILTYHVVAGKVTAADVMKVKSAKTVQGQRVKVKVKKGTVMIDKSKVIKADVMTSNGVIHVIDTVLMPK